MEHWSSKRDRLRSNTMRIRVAYNTGNNIYERTLKFLQRILKLNTNSRVFKIFDYLIQIEIDTKWIRDIRKIKGEIQRYEDNKSWGISGFNELIEKSHWISSLEHGMVK